MSLLLSPLREVSIDRHSRAIQCLKDGSLSVTLTYQTEAEIRALVKNSDGREYGVTLTEHGSYCSCPDALYRRAVCKHAVVLCVKCLQHTQETENLIHLWWTDGTAALCGEKTPKRFWIRWSANALNWPDVCPACVQVWLNPSQSKES